MLSTHNPFRKVTPTATGASSLSEAFVSYDHPLPPSPPLADRITRSSTPPEELPAAPSYVEPGPSASPAERLPLPASPPTDDLINEELPPAYTPIPDVAEGETTLELGPRRAFQQSQQPPRHAQPSLPRRPSRPRMPLIQLEPMPTGAGRGTYPSQRRPQRTGDPSRFDPPPVPAPPRHPSQSYRAQRDEGYAQARPNSAPGNRPAMNTEQLSDFAREFYAAGSANASAVADGTQAPPLPPREATQYAPPPGRPPLPGRVRSRTQTTPDDGRPTERPTPGHPLLRRGQVLVYPAGHECNRCHNIGYRNNDPDQPCNKCWEKYAKPFSGPLAYSWGSEVSSSESTARHTYQRPLPRFTPPHYSSSSSSHRPSQSQTVRSPQTNSLAPPPMPARSRSLTRGSSRQPYIQGFQERPIPVPGENIPSLALAGRAPNGSTVVRPGDPRIGGVLCWRCEGSGVTTFFIFDETTCSECNGLGRVFV